MIFRTCHNYLFNEGSIGIGTLNPSYRLEVRGSIFSKQFTLFDKEIYGKTLMAGSYVPMQKEMLMDEPGHF